MVGKALKPRTGWIGEYGARSLLSDAIAGLVLSILLVPQAMAYAQLAGLPPETGLYAALVPPLLYLLFGTSNYVSVGPVALVSLVVADAARGAASDPAMAATIIAIEAGVLLVALGALGLGRLVNFVSEPVLLGFTAAAAFLIAASQLPTLLGIDADRAGDIVGALGAMWSELGQFSAVTAAIGIGALIALLLVNRYAAPLLWKVGIGPTIRNALAKSLPLLIVVAAGIAALNVSSPVPTVDGIGGGLPTIVLPFDDMGLWLQLAPSAFAVAIVVFVTATAVAKSLAGTDRSHLDTSREAVALGAGNIAAALTGGYAVGASLSRSALVEDSGAKSRVASVIASVVVLAVLFLLAPLLAYLPKAALAALVISAVFGLVKVREIRGVFAHDRVEGAIVVGAFLATLLLGVELGLLIGAGLGLAHFLWFSSLPRVTRIGTDDGGVSFRSVERDEVELDTHPALVVRVDRSIYFGNATFIEDEVFGRLGDHEGVDCLVLDMRAVNAVDASGAAMLQRMITRLKLDGVFVRFAAAHEPVRESLQPIDSEAACFHRTVGHALEACGCYGEGETEVRPGDLSERDAPATA